MSIDGFNIEQADEEIQAKVSEFVQKLKDLITSRGGVCRTCCGDWHWCCYCYGGHEYCTRCECKRCTSYWETHGHPADPDDWRFPDGYPGKTEGSDEVFENESDESSEAQDEVSDDGGLPVVEFGIPGIGPFGGYGFSVGFAYGVGPFGGYGFGVD